MRNEFDLHSHCLLLKWRVTQNLLIYWLFETSYCVLYKGCVWGLKARCSGAKYTCIFLSGIETSEQKRNCKGFFTGSKACSSMQYCFLSAQRNVFTEQGSAWLETWVQLSVHRAMLGIANWPAFLFPSCNAFGHGKGMGNACWGSKVYLLIIQASSTISMTMGSVVNWQQEGLYVLREMISLLKVYKEKFSWCFRIEFQRYVIDLCNKMIVTSNQNNYRVVVFLSPK